MSSPKRSKSEKSHEHNRLKEKKERIDKEYRHLKGETGLKLVELQENLCFKLDQKLGILDFVTNMPQPQIDAQTTQEIKESQEAVGGNDYKTEFMIGYLLTLPDSFYWEAYVMDAPIPSGTTGTGRFIGSRRQGEVLRDFTISLSQRKRIIYDYMRRQEKVGVIEYQKTGVGGTTTTLQESKKWTGENFRYEFLCKMITKTLAKIVFLSPDDFLPQPVDLHSKMTKLSLQEISNASSYDLEHIVSRLSHINALSLYKKLQSNKQLRSLFVELATLENRAWQTTGENMVHLVAKDSPTPSFPEKDIPDLKKGESLFSLTDTLADFIGNMALTGGVVWDLILGRSNTPVTTKEQKNALSENFENDICRVTITCNPIDIFSIHHHVNDARMVIRFQWRGRIHPANDKKLSDKNFDELYNLPLFDTLKADIISSIKTANREWKTNKNPISTHVEDRVASIRLFSDEKGEYYFEKTPGGITTIRGEPPYDLYHGINFYKFTAGESIKKTLISLISAMTYFHDEMKKRPTLTTTNTSSKITTQGGVQKHQTSDIFFLIKSRGFSHYFDGLSDYKKARQENLKMFSIFVPNTGTAIDYNRPVSLYQSRENLELVASMEIPIKEGVFLDPYHPMNVNEWSNPFNEKAKSKDDETMLDHRAGLKEDGERNLIKEDQYLFDKAKKYMKTPTISHLITVEAALPYIRAILAVQISWWDAIQLYKMCGFSRSKSITYDQSDILYTDIESIRKNRIGLLSLYDQWNAPPNFELIRSLVHVNHYNMAIAKLEDHRFIFPKKIVNSDKQVQIDPIFAIYFLNAIQPDWRLYFNY